MLESRFEHDLVEELKNLFPGAVILKNDSSYLQGVPDRLILFQDRWAALETKAGTRASKRPNQQYWVDTFDEMSFAAFINPDNKEDVIRDLQQAFESCRSTCFSRRQ